MNTSDFETGFNRCLDLAGVTKKGRPHYSEEFQRLLTQYFGDFVHHHRFQEWWEDQMDGRIATAIRVFLPWLEKQISLTDKTILEIGCGTGSSTVVLASRAKKVIAVDMHEPSLAAAKQRLKEDGFEQKVEFQHIDTSLERMQCLDESVDVVVYYAVLEHMLPEERRLAFNRGWQKLKPGGALVIYETPNRLWPYDVHTTQLWGWSWLPPSAALKYGKMRKKFQPSAGLEQMYREGYGLTPWEIEKLLAGKEYKTLTQSGRERFPRNILSKILMKILNQPRWALSSMFEIVIQKIK